MLSNIECIVRDDAKKYRATNNRVVLTISIQMDALQIPSPLVGGD